jgi:hypothetical protein
MSEGLGKSYEEMTPAQRAEFINQLNQPHPALDKAIKARVETEPRENPMMTMTSLEGRGEPPEPFIDFAPKFLAAQDAAIEYILPDITPRGAIKLSHGEPRTMKSLAALEEGIAAATGTAAYGLERFRPKRKYRVLYCSQEDAAPIVRPRAKKLLYARGINDFPDTLAFAVHRGIDLDSRQWQERFFADVTTLGFEQVIIDPIRAFTANADKGPADVMPVAKFLRWLIVAGMSVHLVHHDTKPPSNGQDARRRSHRASGGAWFSVSECPVSFERIGDNRALVSPEDYKFSADPRPFTITYHEDHNGIRLIGEDSTAEEAQTLATDEKIINHLGECPAASGSAIAKAIKARKDSVLDSLDRLFRQDRVDFLTHGRAKLWSLRS